MGCIVNFAPNKNFVIKTSDGAATFVITFKKMYWFNTFAEKTGLSV